MKSLGVVILAGVLVITPSISFADEVHIGFPVKLEQFKAYTKERGFDLNDKDGFVENKGQEIVVYSYHTMTPQQMEIVKDATFKNLRN